VLLQVEGRIMLSCGLKESSFYSVTRVSNDLQRIVVQDSQLRKGSAEFKLLEAATQKPDKLQIWGLSSAHFKHNQYSPTQLRQKVWDVRGCKDQPLKHMDSFHAPADARDYIRWRLVPKLRFYQDRIPGYSFRRRTYQAIILISSLFVSLLAALNYPTWTAIVTTVTSAVSGWQEFRDVTMKLSRYSSTVVSLSNILVWWRALTEVDKQNRANVVLLVSKTEKLLEDERNSWISSAVRNERLQKADKVKPGKKGVAGTAGPSSGG